MVRRRYRIDAAKTARFDREGRGRGYGDGYKPWLTIHDVPSAGRSHRILGMTTGRVHHFLSDLERDLFYLLDWQESVCDLREQVPLDRFETMRIAETIGVRHPQVPGVAEPMVMTTDLVADYRRPGRIEPVAYAVKAATDLEKPRTLEKLEIERLYWQERGIAWSIVTRAVLPTRLVRNIAWVHSAYRFHDQERVDDQTIRRFQAAIAAASDQSLHRFCVLMDRDMGSE